MGVTGSKGVGSCIELGVLEGTWWIVDWGGLWREIRRERWRDGKCELVFALVAGGSRGCKGAFSIDTHRFMRWYI